MKKLKPHELLEEVKHILRENYDLKTQVAKLVCKIETLEIEKSIYQKDVDKLRSVAYTKKDFAQVI
jgi:hypothetical protein